MGLQAFFTSGYFNEGNASPDNNYLKRIEGKKLLSKIEKSGLLSKADKAGLTLSRVCQDACTCSECHVSGNNNCAYAVAD